jgi:hypothetical protein
MQFSTGLSIPVRTDLSMSLYWLWNQWVTATDVGRNTEGTEVGAQSAQKREILTRNDVRHVRLRIGDFTKDSWAASAGGRGQVTGALVECFVG